MNTSKNRQAKIAKLNDEHRQNIPKTRTYVSQQVSNLPIMKLAKLFYLVKNFNTFNKDNDPHREHDLGKVILDGESYFWKIDYYDKSLEYGSPDPTNPAVTERILTICHQWEL